MSQRTEQGCLLVITEVMAFNKQGATQKGVGESRAPLQNKSQRDIKKQFRPPSSAIIPPLPKNMIFHLQN